MIVRLKKGLRVRTLEARAHSFQRIFRWAKKSDKARWPDTSELLEDYMNDLSTRKGAGVSTFDRARYAYLYAEAGSRKGEVVENRRLRFPKSNDTGIDIEACGSERRKGEAGTTTALINSKKMGSIRHGQGEPDVL